MKRINKPQDDDEMRLEYDFTTAVRNPYVTSIEPGSRAIALDDDISKIFTSPKQIEQALRYLLEFARTHAPTALLGQTGLSEAKPVYRMTDRPKSLEVTADMVLSVMVSPQILEVFPTRQAVNEALRTLIYLSTYSQKAAA